MDVLPDLSLTSIPVLSAMKSTEVKFMHLWKMLYKAISWLHLFSSKKADILGAKGVFISKNNLIFYNIYQEQFSSD